MASRRYPSIAANSLSKLRKMEINVFNWLASYFGVNINEKECSGKPEVAFAKRKALIGEHNNLSNS